jgi:hypothetical protein
MKGWAGMTAKSRPAIMTSCQAFQSVELIGTFEIELFYGRAIEQTAEVGGTNPQAQTRLGPQLLRIRQQIVASGEAGRRSDR